MGYRALVIEDSHIFQKVMVKVLDDIDAVDTVAVAGTGLEGIKRIAAGVVDVLFLDMNLPDMTGMDILDKLRGKARAPEVIVVSATGGRGTDQTINALQKGAFSYICKPSGASYRESLKLLKSDLERALAALGASRSSAPRTKAPVAPRPVPTTVAPRPVAASGDFWITAFAVSTGGPQALTEVVPALPADYPTPVVVVQHMPPDFTASLARSLDERSALRVVEAQDGMIVKAGFVYVAPGGRHLTVTRERGTLVARLDDGPPVCNVKPAADVLFRSLAGVSGRGGVLTVVMTGMGEDGREGVAALKEGRCFCLSQARESCVVYGMPRAVDEAGLADESVPLERIAERLTALHPVAAR